MSKVEKMEIGDNQKKRVKIIGGYLLWLEPIIGENNKWTTITTKNMRNRAKKYTDLDLYNKSNSEINNMIQRLLNKCIKPAKSGKDLPKISNTV